MSKPDYEPNKYLYISIHDNDFTPSLEEVCNVLYDLFLERNFPEESDLEALKPLIQDMWYSIHMTEAYMAWLSQGMKYTAVSKDYYEPDLKIVDYEDIPTPAYGDWDTGYVPLFAHGKTFIR